MQTNKQYPKRYRYFSYFSPKEPLFVQWDNWQSIGLYFYKDNSRPPAKAEFRGVLHILNGGMTEKEEEEFI